MTGSPDIVVESRRRYQQFWGVGASLTGSSAVVLDTLSPAQRSGVMRDIFDRRRGIGLSILRQPLGGSDFSSSGDDSRVLPLLREAARLNPSLAVELSPWSAPASAKTTGSVVGGTLRPDAYDDYARHLVSEARRYRQAGVPVRGLTVQNEPSYSPPSYPGMTLDVAQQRALVRDHLGPRLEQSGLGLHLWLLDDNFDRWQDADALLSDPATARHAYGVAFHCYRGDVSALREIRRRHPDKGVAVSECSGGVWATSYGDDLRFEARTMLTGAVRDGASWLVKWNLALDTHGGPRHGGCRGCRGLVTVDTGTGRVTHSAGYDAWAHLGRFVVPGARVVASTARHGTPLDVVAFQNPDGSHVLVVYNAGGGPTGFTVGADGRSFRERLAAGSLATYTW